MNREQQDPCPRGAPPDFSGRDDTVHSRELHVHDHDVGRMRIDGDERIACVAGFTDDRELGIGGQALTDSHPEQRMVFDEEDFRHGQILPDRTRAGDPRREGREALCPFSPNVVIRETGR